MIITFGNRSVNIRIPYNKRQLKKEVFEALEDAQIITQDFLDPHKRHESQSRMRIVGLLADNPDMYETVPVKNIGIWCSGGADSSILLYCLALKIKNEKRNIKIHPFSVRRQRPWNPVYAEGVVDFIRSTVSDKIVQPITIYYPDIAFPDLTERLEFHYRDHEHFKNNIIDINYNGITSNPPADSGVPLEEAQRVRDITAERPLIQTSPLHYAIQPFFRVDKSFLYEIYKKYNLLDSLFPITRSCEGFKEDTDNWTKHCGRCWWCKERFWAFGRLV